MTRHQIFGSTTYFSFSLVSRLTLSFLLFLEVVTLFLSIKMILFLVLIFATAAAAAPTFSTFGEEYNTYTNDYCATYLFAGHVNENQARGILNAALEFLDGFHNDNRRPTIHDTEAQGLLYMMTGEVHIGFVRPRDGQFMKRPRLQDPEYQPEPQTTNVQRKISRETATRILELLRTGKSSRTIKSKYRWFQRRYIPRLQRIAETGASGIIYQDIDERVYNRAREARMQHRVLRGWMLRLWAMEEARWLRAERFRASNSWLVSFKKRHGLVSRKITEFISRRRQTDDAELAIRRSELASNFARRRQSFPDQLILNFDQSGFQYELTTGRTLSWSGERDTLASVDQANKATHSYTIQPIISRDGRAVGKLLICLQETSGNSFGPRVQQEVDRLVNEYGNVVVMASSSGKMNNPLMRRWADEVLIPAIREERDQAERLEDEVRPSTSDGSTGEQERRPQVLLVGDSWGGNTNVDFIAHLNAEGVEFLRILPGLTSTMQPLDVEIFRQYKYLIKRLTDSMASRGEGRQLATRGGIINMHSVVWNQFAAPSYADLHRYGWRNLDVGFDRSELSTGSVPDRVIALQFSFPVGSRCQHQNCTESAFISCAYCGTLLCERHFLDRTCFHTEETDDAMILTLDEEEDDEDFDPDLFSNRYRTSASPVNSSSSIGPSYDVPNFEFDHYSELRK